jgi:acetyl esterase/lipase
VPGDTAGLAELLQFISDWPSLDRDRPGVSPAGVVSNRAGNARQPPNDLDQSIFLPSSPLVYAGPDAPPFFVAHGDKDSLLPVSAARLFVERLRATSSNPVVYAELPGAQHGFDRFHSLRFDTVVDAIEAFAAWVRSREMAS